MKSNLFQCVRKSMSTCKTDPSVPGFASTKLGTINDRQIGFGVPSG